MHKHSPVGKGAAGPWACETLLAAGEAGANAALYARVRAIGARLPSPKSRKDFARVCIIHARAPLPPHMHARTHAYARARVNTRTYIHMHTHAHARARARTHTHTHTHEMPIAISRGEAWGIHAQVFMLKSG